MSPFRGSRHDCEENAERCTGWDPLTAAVAVVAAVAASLLVYRDVDRQGHHHALSASAAVGIAALVGFTVANLVGLAVATGYVLLLCLLSSPNTPGIDGDEKRRTPDRLDGTPQGDAGENIAAAEADDVVSVIRVEIANEETLRELAGRYADVPTDAPIATLRSMLRVKALSNVVDEAETDDEFSLRDWAETDDEDSVDDWHDESPSDESERLASGAAAWNGAPSGEEPATHGASAAAETGNDSTPDETGVDQDIEALTAETVDEDAGEIEAGSIEERTAVGDGGESTETATNERGEAVSSATTTNEASDDKFGWADVEAEE
jgi:hypothetical protein